MVVDKEEGLVVRRMTSPENDEEDSLTSEHARRRTVSCTRILGVLDSVFPLFRFVSLFLSLSLPFASVYLEMGCR